MQTWKGYKFKQFGIDFKTFSFKNCKVTLQEVTTTYKMTGRVISDIHIGYTQHSRELLRET